MDSLKTTSSSWVMDKSNEVSASGKTQKKVFSLSSLYLPGKLQSRIFLEMGAMLFDRQVARHG